MSSGCFGGLGPASASTCRPSNGAGFWPRLSGGRLERLSGPPAQASTARSRPGERGAEIERLPDTPELVAPDAGRVRLGHEKDGRLRHDQDGPRDHEDGVAVSHHAVLVTHHGMLLGDDDHVSRMARSDDHVPGVGGIDDDALPWGDDDGGARRDSMAERDHRPVAHAWTRLNGGRAAAPGAARVRQRRRDA